MGARAHGEISCWWSDPDSSAPKLAKATKKSKPSAPKVAPVTKHAAAKASKSTSSQQPKPKPVPAKTQEKKRKMVTETFDEPSLAKSSKPGLVTKRRKPTSSLSLVDEFVDEGIYEREPMFNDEEANMQRAVEESLKSVHDAHRGPLPPVVFREPDSGKFQPLPEVQGKGKEKVSDEQFALDLLTLQTPKKVSHAKQYIFQWRTPIPTEPSCHAKSPSIYIELGLTDSDIESDEEVPHMVKIRAQDEGQVGPNPGVQIEGQAGSNSGDDAEPQPQSSHVVHAGPNLEHMDLEATDVSTQQNPEQIDEGFTATAYPNVQENLKLTVEEHVILEEPVSSTGTLSSLKHLAKDFSFGDQFFNDNHSGAKNEKTTAKTEAESMVPDSPNDHRPLPGAAAATTTTITTLPLPPLPQQGTTYSIKKRIDELDKIIANLIQDNKHLEERTSRSSRAFGSSQLPPHSLPLSTSQSDQSKSTAAPSSSKTTALAKYTAWTTTDTILKSSVSSIPEDLHMDDDTAPDEQVHSSDDEDIRNAHIPKVNLKQDWWKPLEEDKPATLEPTWSIPSSDLSVPMNNWASALASTYTPLLENSLLAQTGDMAIFMDWFCKKQRITKLKLQDLEGLAFDIVKVFHPNVIHLQHQIEECRKLLTNKVDESIIRYNVSKPLPLGGSPGWVTIQSDFFFNKDLEYLRYGRKGGRPALSISKIKVAYYPDVGLEQMVLDQIHSYEGDHRAVRTHMRILSVVRIKVFSMYGYDYMKKIVLHRADLNEHIIAKRDFRYLYPRGFKDMYLLNLQEDFQLGIESYQTQLNLTKPRWDATGFEYKHDFTVIDSLRAVTFRDKYGVQMIMRFNEIHKFNDITLHQIGEALDYRVKEFKVNRMNPGLNTRF
nr:hypothetical protein [Tanacetum cinerariifolium]